MDWPARPGALDHPGGPFSRKPSCISMRCSSSNAANSAANSGFCCLSDNSHAACASSVMASAWSRYGLIICQRSGLSLRIVGHGQRLVQIWTYNLPAFGTKRAHRDSSDLQIRANFLVQINTSLFPIALHGSFGNILHGGDFHEGKTAKELQIDDRGEGRLHFAKLVQGLADSDKLPVVHGILHRVGVERSNLKQAAALLSVPFSGMIDD